MKAALAIVVGLAFASPAQAQDASNSVKYQRMTVFAHAFARISAAKAWCTKDFTIPEETMLIAYTNLLEETGYIPELANALSIEAAQEIDSYIGDNPFAKIKYCYDFKSEYIAELLPPGS